MGYGYVAVDTFLLCFILTNNNLTDNNLTVTNILEKVQKTFPSSHPVKDYLHKLHGFFFPFGNLTILIHSLF